MVEENITIPQEPASIPQPVEIPPIIQSEPIVESAPIDQPQTPVQQPEPTPLPPTISQPQAQPSSRSFLAKALEKIQFRKKAKLEKILKFAQDKKSITNDQVEKLLHVSDATATRYLSELVKQNKLKRTGLPQNPRYEPSGGSNGGN